MIFDNLPEKKINSMDNMDMSDIKCFDIPIVPNHRRGQFNVMCNLSDFLVLSHGST